MVLTLIIVAVLLVLGVGVLIFLLMRRSQKVVPDVADRRAAGNERVVAVDEQGRELVESPDDDGPPRDDAGFESLLKDEIRDQGREEPVADDED